MYFELLLCYNIINMSNPLEREIRISIGNSKNFTRFKPELIKFNQLWKIVADPSKAYSFSWYKNDYRSLKNVIPGVDAVALDFDTCENVDKIIEEKLNQYYGFIAPTKSYMKDKGGIIVPRYRVILLLEQTTYLETMNYSQAYTNMLEDIDLQCCDCCKELCQYASGCSCDTAVKDPSRLFYGASIDTSLIRPLKGGAFLDFKSFDYPKPSRYNPIQAAINAKIDISRYTHIDISKYDNLDPSTRYECPICAMNGDDPNKHHLGVSADGKYVTCFYDYEHSQILRKLRYKDELQEQDKEQQMVKLRATPDLIPVKKYNPQPTNCNIHVVRQNYDKILKELEPNNQFICLDIETYPPEYLAWSIEEAEEKLGNEYKYIRGAWNTAAAEAETDALDCYKANVRLFSITNIKRSALFDTAIMTEGQLEALLKMIRTAGMVAGQNLKYDLLTMCYRYTPEVVMPKYAFDTMLAARIHQSSIDIEPSPAGNSLGPLLHRYCGIDIDKEVEHTWGESNLELKQLHYAIRDTKYIPVLMNAQIAALKESLGTFDYKNHPKEELKFLGPLLDVHPIVALEMQFLLELVRIEYNGIKPDLPYLTSIADAFYKEFDEAQAEVGINLNSPNQMVQWLRQNVDPNINTSSYKELGPIYEGDPQFDKVMKARKKYKVAGLLDAMTAVREDGKLHPHFTQILNTGRQSCKDPNMQQIPQKHKHAIYSCEGADILQDPEKLQAYKTEMRSLLTKINDLETQIKELENA